MNFIVTTLKQLVEQNPTKVSVINSCYQKLLSQLSECPIISDQDFIHKLNLINQVQGTIFIAYINNINDQDFQIVTSGTILIEPKFIHNSSAGHIEDIVTDSNFRGRGLAKLILDALKNYAFNTKNVYKIILDCNESLEPVYNKNNFTRKGLQMALYK